MEVFDTPAQNVIISDPVEVAEHLDRLGLPLDFLNEGRMAWARAAAGASPFGPVTGPGTLGWIEGVSFIRQGMTLRGWMPTDIRNWPLIVSPDRRTGLTLATGDHMTGLKSGPQPTTKNTKGFMVADAARKNGRQIMLNFPIQEIVSRPQRAKPSEAPDLVWILLAFATPTELRAELSVPTAIDRRKVVGWGMRLLLPSIPREPSPGVHRSEEEVAPVDFEVSITRKSA